jgi:homocitrate synthase NifV
MAESIGGAAKPVTLRDCTLREGRDVPGVAFTWEQVLSIAALLAEARVPELEVVAPAHVEEDVVWAARLREAALGVRVSGLVYAAGAECRAHLADVGAAADRCEVLMPLAAARVPHERGAKQRAMTAALDHAASLGVTAGAGFPHAFQVEPELVCDMCAAAAGAGADRVTIYDTNGSADPFAVFALIARAKQTVRLPVFFHGHNDLGLATANAYAAARAGADGLDVTVNGLGDRAGNASLEQVAVLLHLRGLDTGIVLPALEALSDRVARESGVPVPPLAPIVGAFAATHVSPGHMEALGAFEAFDAALVGLERKTTGG